MIQNIARRRLKRPAQLPHDVLQGHDQCQLRVIEDLQVPDQVLVKLIDSFPDFMEGEAGLFQEQEVPLDRARGWSGIACSARCWRPSLFP
jgi:hypothetical protein